MATLLLTNSLRLYGLHTYRPGFMLLGPRLTAFFTLGSLLSPFNITPPYFPIFKHCFCQDGNSYSFKKTYYYLKSDKNWNFSDNNVNKMYAFLLKKLLYYLLVY